MKKEWRKEEKAFYLPSEQPERIHIPAWRFLAITGEGNPNTPAFSERIEALYSCAYAIRMMPKTGVTPEGYQEYTVYPLEGLWSLPNTTGENDPLDKDQLLYTLMIRQPDFVTDEIAERAVHTANKKKPLPLLQEVRLSSIEEGLCVQVLHIGSFDEEPRSFEKMKQFMQEQKLSLRSREHREIYLSNFEKTAKENLKTVLRYRVKED
ncbi:GyrI-like domain-containing protein [Gorillibacterium timonense]|uniref:GyrI-like domain-containing protein n=1 Tax=Gorillibacterium timonense TaxID=1689269 RepID=UPI00071C857B|nr:GyrI-like domain-containing protein [Gorillibacterium timonense]